MTLEITPEMLDEIHSFINSGDLVNLMNEQGISVEGMCFILQALLSAVDDAEQLLDDH